MEPDGMLLLEVEMVDAKSIGGFGGKWFCSISGNGNDGEMINLYLYPNGKWSTRCYDFENPEMNGYFPSKRAVVLAIRKMIEKL